MKRCVRREGKDGKGGKERWKVGAKKRKLSGRWVPPEKADSFAFVGDILSCFERLKIFRHGSFHRSLGRNKSSIGI